MRYPAGVLRPAMADWYRTDSDIIAGFGAHPVQVFAKKPPVNAVPPYIYIPPFFFDDTSAECLDAIELDLQVSVFTLQSPPQDEQCEVLTAAVESSTRRMADTGDSPAFTVSGFRIVAVLDGSLQLVDQPDGKTVHGIVRKTLAIDPV